MEQTASSSVRVNIYGDEYPIRGEADPEYIHKLASYVDEKMRGISETVTPREKVRVAVLAAVNIASELFESRGEPGSDSFQKLTEFQTKAEEINLKIEKGLAEIEI